MKLKNFVVLFPYFIFATTSFMPAGDHYISGVALESDIYGPYDGSEGEIEFKFSYTYFDSTSRTRVYEKLTSWSGGKIVYRDQSDYHTLIKNQTVKSSLFFSTRPLLDDPTLLFEFIIYDERTGDYIVSKSLSVDRKSPRTIYPIRDNIREYESSGTTFSLSGTFNEKYYFDHIYDFFANEVYYRLDISNQKIKYECEQPFTYTSAQLIYYDFEGLFPYYEKEGKNRKMTINLTINQSDEWLSFGLPKFVYVNKKTLDISTTRHNGFTLGQYYYLPLGKKDLFEGKKFQIVIDGFGQNGNKIIYDLTYYSSNNLFGSCSSSDYCIQGEEI